MPESTALVVDLDAAVVPEDAVVSDDALVAEDLIEEVSIDGMCGVY